MKRSLHDCSFKSAKVLCMCNDNFALITLAVVVNNVGRAVRYARLHHINYAPSQYTFR